MTNQIDVTKDTSLSTTWKKLKVFDRFNVVEQISKDFIVFCSIFHL